LKERKVVEQRWKEGSEGRKREGGKEGGRKKGRREMEGADMWPRTTALEERH